MSETLAELAETDAFLTALSRGGAARSGDPVFNALAGWVDEITSHPVPRFEVELPEFYARETGGRAWRIAAAAIVVTAMSSSGIAAAATGDPLAPFSYVARALGHLAPTDPGVSRLGSHVVDGIDRGTNSRDGRHANADGSQLYWPVADESHGQHRALDDQPRHRADQGEDEGSATDAAYTPRHATTDDGTVTTPVTLPNETPLVDAPPVETPGPEDPTQPGTAPASDPAPGGSDPQPVPSDGSGDGSPAGESAPTDSEPTDAGATGGDATGSATDSAQVKMGDDALADTAADQATGL